MFGTAKWPSRRARVRRIVAQSGGHGPPYKTKGPVCWILNGVRVLRTPIPCSGACGPWTVPRDIFKQVREAGA